MGSVPSPEGRARIVALLLWAVLWFAIVLVIVMTWHPWVIGERRDCPAQQTTGWDGRCHQR
jgi:hypothetical protein